MNHRDTEAKQKRLLCVSVPLWLVFYADSDSALGQG